MNAQTAAVMRALRVRTGIVLGVLALSVLAAALAGSASARRATLLAQGAATRETVRYVLRDGGELADAVPDLVGETDRVGLSVQIFDASGKALGGNAQLAQASAGHAPAAGNDAIAQLEIVPVSGGYIVLAPSPRALGTQFALLVFAIAVSFGGIWLLLERLQRASVARAFRSVDTVTQALGQLAEGDLSRRELVESTDVPADALTHAYNGAARRVAATLEAQAATEERMRRFLGDAGHELRTPLAVINGYIDLLKRGALGEREAAIKIVETMGEEGDRMTGMLERLLRLARLDTVAAAKSERIDLGALACDLVESLRPLAGTRELTVACEAGLIIEADRAELAEAVRNVLDNAFKYAPGAAVHVTVASRETWAELAVSDRGPGLSDDARAHAFERFFRGDERGEVAGSGLGLSIVKRVVERANGAVSLEAGAGGGTRAVLRLPLLTRP